MMVPSSEILKSPHFQGLVQRPAESYADGDREWDEEEDDPGLEDEPDDDEEEEKE